MIILVYILIGLWLAKGFFEIARALVLICCGLLCGAVAVFFGALSLILGAFEWLWGHAKGSA